MNRNYLFILIAVVAIVLIVMVYSMAATSSLDQIIKNKDCTALSKWEEEHIFDDNLNISSEQLSSTMKLATECVGKALGNTLGSSSNSLYSNSEIVEATSLFEVIYEARDCTNLKKWKKVYGLGEDLGFTTPQMGNVLRLDTSCNYGLWISP